MSHALVANEAIYEVTASFVSVTEFGISLEDFLTGAASPPPQGMRINVDFEGSIAGRLQGTIWGTDYLLVRADGRTELNIHATITTDTGANVSFFAGGLGIPHEDGHLELREHVTLSTAHPEYEWVNQLAIWAVGRVNPATGEIRVTAYSV
jgi:Protein of unknown function (DUF3237)